MLLFACMPADKFDALHPAVPARHVISFNPSAAQFSMLGSLLICAAVLVAYWPARHGDFVLDDDLLLTHNSIIQSPNGLYRFWFSKQPADYWPVTNSTLWLEWRLWGMNPTGYHLTNLLLHMIDSLLVWLVLKRLGIPGAFLAGLLFAVHPVNVESVAWIAQRKNVLALMFGLLSLLLWLAAERKFASNTSTTNAVQHAVPRGAFGRWYGMSLGAFVLAMLSKGSVAIFPIVLLLLTWWRHGRVKLQDLLCSAPFFAVSAVLSWVDIWFQRQGSGEIIRDVNFWQRMCGAGAAVWFYLGKALLPIRLSFVYPAWNIQASNLLWWLPCLAAIAVTLILIRQRNSNRTLWARSSLFAWVFFAISLLPVMGFTDVGFMRHSLVADHYQHIAIIALVALVASAVAFIFARVPTSLRWAVVTPTGVVVLALTFLARQQSALYAGPMFLYEDTIQKNPASWLAHNNLGNALVDAGRKSEALAEFERTVELNPDSSIAHNNLGMRFYDSGQLAEAIDHFQKAIRLQNNYADAYHNLAMSLDRLGQSEAAVAQLQLAIKYQPDFAEAHYHLGAIYLNAGQLENAMIQLEQALKIKSDYFEARNDLGLVLSKSGVFPEAIQQYTLALRLKPDSPETHSNLGNALAKSGQLEDAIAEYQQAVRLRPDYAQAYVNLAMTEAVVGHAAEAEAAARSALKLARLQNDTRLTAQIEAWLVAHHGVALQR
ncbi:MAG TPA: tetratricopeptide repeat protein [Pirellulales bacterium]|jgi:tetratricopeptide (TPR) repeat protein|nr:tetratricopeptide repeat protein [Pirellulales bacterium]